MFNKKDLLVIVPAFNEEQSIVPVTRSLKALGFPVLVIDDGSTDRTGQVAICEGVEVLRLPINLGVGGALRAGFRFALENGFKAIVQIDADGQHPVHQIGNLLDAASQSGADLILGSRFLDNSESMKISLPRRLVMRILARSASRACGTQITDATSGFRLIQGPLLSEFAASFPTYYLGDTYEAIVAAGRSGYQVVEVSSQIGPRVWGKSTSSVLRSCLLIGKTLALVTLNIHFSISEKFSPGTDSLSGAWDSEA